MAGAEEPAWASKSLRRRCECELCKTGVPTSHNDDSHDQSLRQVLSLRCATRPTGEAVNATVLGGTTKCARVASAWLARGGLAPLEGKVCVEVGSGTGLVSMAMALLGARVIGDTPPPPARASATRTTARIYPAPPPTRNAT